MVGIAYQTCVEASLGAISVIFHAVCQTLMEDSQLYIQWCIDFVGGAGAGVVKMVRGG